MDSSILLALIQDGIVSGAIYALLALALVLVFAVTRTILIPVGEIVSFAALTYANLDNGQPPAVIVLLLGLGVAAFLRGAIFARGRGLIALGSETLILPGTIAVAATLLAPMQLGVAMNAAIAIAVAAPIAPLLYRLAFAPLAEASVLVLLMARIWSRHSGKPWQIAFERGLAPIAAGLILATTLTLARSLGGGWPAYAVTLVVAVVMMVSRLNPLWMIGGGAVVFLLAGMV